MHTKYALNHNMKTMYKLQAGTFSMQDILNGATERDEGPSSAFNLMKKLRALMGTAPDYKKDANVILHKLEQVVYLTYCIATSVTNADRARHIGAFLVYRTSSSISARAIEFLTKNVPELFSENYRVQSAELRELLDNWDRANESPLAAKLRAVASYCMAFSILETCGFTPAFAEIMYAEFRVRKESKKVTSFIYSILDVAEFVLSRARVCWDKGSLGPLFHNTGTYLDWFAKVDEVRHLSHTRGSPDDIEGLRDMEYFAMLDDCIVKGESMVKFTKTQAERKAMQALINELKILQHNCGIEKAVSRPREEPLGILIPGDPGVGKSSLTQMLGRIYASVRGLDFNSGSRFDRNPFDPFMSGFKSSMWFIVMDDVACMEPSKCPAGDTSLADVIQLINMAPYTSNQAELEKKGKVPVLAKLIVANTNVLNLNAFHFFSHPSAVQRRFKFVLHPYVKEEFRRIGPDGVSINMLDGEKATTWYQEKKNIINGDPMPDYWDFEVIQWQPVPIGGEKKLAINHYPFGRNAQGKPNRIGLAQFVPFYTKLVASHIENQIKMLTNLEAMKVTGVCCVCRCLAQHCENRSVHEFYDDVECTDCHKTACYNKHQCGMCAHNMFTYRCTICRTTCEHGIHHEVCPTCAMHEMQSAQVCTCGQSTCLWKHYPCAIATICKTCNHCMSEEDVLEGSCTICLVKAQYAKDYHPQSYGADVVGWFSLYVLAFMLQLRKMFKGDLRAILPESVQTQHGRLTILNVAGVGMVDSLDSIADTMNNSYQVWATTRASVIATATHAGEWLKQRPCMVLIGGALAIIAILQKGVKWHDALTQSQEMQPTPKNERVDIWKKDVYVLTPQDVGRKVKNFRQWAQEEVKANVSKNVFIGEISTAKGVRRTRLLAVAGQHYLVNTHALNGCVEGMLKIYRGASEGVHDGARDIPLETHMITHLSPDVSILYLPQLPPRTNIVDMFAKRTYNARTHGYYVGRDNDCRASIEEVKNVRTCMFKNKAINDGDKFRVFEATTMAPTQDGFCGTPLIAATTLGPAIVGIHVAGNMHSSALAAAVCLEDLNEYFRRFEIVNVGEFDLTSEHNTYELQGLHEKSWPRYLDEGSVTIVGSLKGQRSTPKSKVVPTLISTFLIDKYGFKQTHGPPQMGGYRPIHHAVVPMVVPSLNLPHSLVLEAVADTFATAESRLHADEYDVLQKLALEVAINGADGIRGIDKINIKTSAGFPHQCGKEELFIKTDEKYTMGHELTMSYEKSLKIYAAGERNNFVFKASLKDEPREFAKITEGKTRVFTGQNVTHLIIGRQYYLSFIRLMQRNNLAFENAVGSNAHSDDWDRVAHYLVDFSTHLFDGDYKNYDKSMMAMVIMEIFNGIIQFHRDHSGMDEEDFVVMRGVAYDIAFAYVDFFGDLVSFLRNNPSGHLLTVIINSLCGSVYLRIGFVLATGLPMLTFRENVRPVTYGDDVIVAVSDDIKNTFNFITYRNAMAQFGIGFTPASKDGSEYELKSLKDVDFLKRTFVYHTVLERYVSPLADKSIKKSLMVHIKSSSITPEEQIVATLASAHREAWQHGEQYFVEFDNMVHDIIVHHNLGAYVGKNMFLKSWELLDYYRGQVQEPSPNGIKAVLGVGYELQSSWMSAYENESDHPPCCSYCVHNNRESVHENGQQGHIHQGVPLSTYPSVVRLMAIIAILLFTVIAAGEGHTTIAQNNKENVRDYVSSQDGSLDMHTQIFTGITGDTGGVGTEIRSYNNGGTAAPVPMDIANFLSRPLVIKTGTWTPAEGIYEDIDLLTLWLSNTAVSNKVNNYAFLRGKLCARIVVDSTPFNYGLLHVSMLAGAHSIQLTDTNSTLYTTYLTQRPGGFLNPSIDKSLDLESMLLYRSEWFSLDGGGEHVYGEKGVNFTINTLSQLKSASANTAVYVTYRVYAWMEEVELSGATYVVQSEEVVVRSTQEVSQSPNSQLICLAEDVLQPGLGLPVADLVMAKYLDVNPAIARMTWADTDISGSKLLGIDPCPSVTRVLTTPLVECSTPLSFLDRYFMHWRGSLIFTFRVIASKYHSGTLRVTWDPLSTQGGEANIQMTKVVNIQEESEFEFVVPHNSNNYAFDTDDRIVYPVQHFFNGVSFPSIVTKNGFLAVKVMNRLTGPSDGATVDIWFHVRPGPDFQFMRVSDGTDDLGSTYTIQSQDINYVEMRKKQYMGEEFTDLRKLLERPQLYNTIYTGSVAGSSVLMDCSESRYPVGPGPSLEGPWQTTNNSTFVPVKTPSSAVNTHFNTRNTLLAQLIPQYVGVAGSMVHTVLALGTQKCTVSVGTIRDAYSPFALPIGSYTPYAPGAVLPPGPPTYQTYVPKSLASSNIAQYMKNNLCGSQWIIPTVNPVGHIRMPHLSKYKYYRSDNVKEWDTVGYSLYNNEAAVQLNIWISIGEDFQLVQFSGVLPMGHIATVGYAMYPTSNGINRAA